MSSSRLTYASLVLILLACWEGQAQDLTEAQVARLVNLTQAAVNSNSVTPNGEAEEFTEEELDSWKPPEWVAKNYPFYLSGYDDEQRPIWVAEWGRFDLRKIAEGGEERRKLFRKYAAWAERIIGNSTEVPENPLKEMNVILDFDGFKLDQIISLPTITYALDVGRDHREAIEYGRITRIVIINANYLTETFLRLGRSVFGKIFEVIEVYGPKSRWLPRLLRIFPRDQLPEWYGGLPGHKPVAIYG